MVKMALFSCKSYDKAYFTDRNQDFGYQLQFWQESLSLHNLELAKDADVVCLFVNDCADKEVIAGLAELGVKLIALRCAGFNNVDLDAAAEYQMPVVRVPAYSPASVAEHSVGLMLALNRKFHKAYNRVREGNFALDGLMGFDLEGKTAGVIGAGKIGMKVAKILSGFGMEILLHDPAFAGEAAFGTFVPLNELYQRADVISLHCPLNDATYHLINEAALNLMKPSVMLINTGRGGLIDTKAVINALKSKSIGSLGLDVYEQEESLFFNNHSEEVILDDAFERLTTFPNVLITGHQGFFTHEALTQISNVTLENVQAFEQGQPLLNRVVR